MFDLTVEAFNTAEAYRTPVVVLADQTVGHMTGRVEVPEAVATRERPRPEGEPDPETFEPFDGDVEVPPMAVAGDGYRVHVTGLTHDDRGYPDIEPPAQRRMLGRLMAKIQDHRDDIVDIERFELDEAEVAVLAYGSSGRAARQAVRELREEGIEAGLLRVRTVWPFPEAEVGLAGSHTEVVSFEAVSTPERRGEWIEGDAAAQAAALAGVVRQATGR